MANPMASVAAWVASGSQRLGGDVREALGAMKERGKACPQFQSGIGVIRAACVQSMDGQGEKAEPCRKGRLDEFPGAIYRTPHAKNFQWYNTRLGRPGHTFFPARYFESTLIALLPACGGL